MPRLQKIITCTVPPEYYTAAAHLHNLNWNAECKKKKKIIPLKMCSAEHYKLDKAVCAKHIATESSVFPTGTEVRPHARRSAAHI